MTVLAGYSPYLLVSVNHKDDDALSCSYASLYLVLVSLTALLSSSLSWLERGGDGHQGKMIHPKDVEQESKQSLPTKRPLKTTRLPILTRLTVMGGVRART